MLEIERALLADIIHKHTTKNNKNLFKELESHKEKESQKGKGKGREREKRFSYDYTNTLPEGILTLIPLV